MTIRNIIKNSLLTEVGEASKRPFRYKRDREDMWFSKDQKDIFSYNFKTKEGYTYSVSITRKFGQSSSHYDNEPLSREEWREELSSIYNMYRSDYINLLKLGAKKNDFKGIWEIAFAIDEHPPEKEEESEGSVADDLFDDEGKIKDIPKYTGSTESLINSTDSDGFSWLGNSQRIYTANTYRSDYDEPNAGEFYKVMSTITKIIKDHIEKHGGKILLFRPMDDRRGRVFTRYILKQMPRTKFWVSRDNDFYFLLKK